uniref:Glutamate--tRNA ligase 1 n=1 Tax=Anthurium amnicola TaxID=1678845 RepID=A0A1D1XKH1_9ARAE
MNEFQNRKVVRDLQKPIPGCMGRIVNILDLNAGTTGKKMLTDRANRDGSPVRRNRPDIPKKMVDPVALQIEDKPVTYEQKMCASKKGSSGTPMKMLIAQEMSRGTETNQKSPSVVAKLMGLDAIPARQPVPITQRASNECYKHSVYRHDVYPSDLKVSTHCYRQHEDGYFDESTLHDRHPSKYYLDEQKEYKDVYELWQQRSSHKKDHPSSKSHHDDTDDNRMALVRQKFMEAKRLATDQKLLQTKEFQDALEVLNSNRDLFLKFLEEPNSLLSKHLQELRTAATSSQTKRITVLKPSNSVKSDVGMRKQQALEDEHVNKDSLSGSQGFVHPKADNLSQPTRIVVLKPSPRKLQDLKASVGSPTSCRGFLKEREIFKELETAETRSREVAKDITQHMRESLSGNQMDESLFSSVLSHGYIGDDSSFNRSENEFMEDDDGNFSDLEIVTPTSRQSWDYVYRFGSPYSLSSLSQTSYSPESSVIREAKKRLSERWAMVASNGTTQEQKLVRKGSSTLGEMLAISELKKGEGNNVLSGRSWGGEHDMRLPSACSSFSRNEEGNGRSESPKNLLRSKSVPVFSSAYGNIRLNVDGSAPEVNKSNASKDTNRLSGKLSLRGKVSSLFFSRIKRPSREKTATSPPMDTPDRDPSANLESISKSGDFPACAPDNAQLLSQKSEKSTCETSSLPASANDKTKEADLSTEAATTLEEPRAPENSNEIQEQPSPISVLEMHFEDDVNSSSSRSSEGSNLECCQLISRSPPIESVARSMSWNEAGAGTSPLKIPKILSEKGKDEARYSFVKALLSSAGFEDEKFSSVLARWHAPESPLDPLLLDKFMEHEDKEAKCMERRSNQRLLFDCVNTALLDISRTNIWDRMRNVSYTALSDDAPIIEEVWRCIKEWFQGEEKQATSPARNISLMVDRVLRKEMARRGWGEMVPLERDEIGKEIQGKVLDELLEEALDGLL